MWPIVVSAAVVALIVTTASAQLAWSPIYVDGSSQVDLWTQSTSGCACPGELGHNECACCVREGGCPCGRAAPGRCTQCGLEQHCANMCNITIDSRVLKSSSGKSFGQIKSPSIEGPGLCSYLLQPDTGQRVEIQVYRLISVGKFNGTSCVGGFLQLTDGTNPSPRPSDTQVCGVNERYTPPIVLFADHGASTLIFKITEQTARSQFLAYFSFTSLSNNQGVGFHPSGGSRISKTDCDWFYQDTQCGMGSDSEACILASPGFPGLFPPHRKCKYLLTTTSAHTRIKIKFTSILMPKNHCTSDYLALYQGSSTSAPLLTTLCNQREAEFEYQGPNLLLEFNSGSPVPPFDYNGFLARVTFLEKITTTERPATQPASIETFEMPVPKASSPTFVDGHKSRGSSSGNIFGCGAVIDGRRGGFRSGHYDTRISPWRATCSITFLGRPTDVVQLTLFNYHLKSQSCRSVIEVMEGTPPTAGAAVGQSRASRPALRVCSPAERRARDPSGRFVERRPLVSRGSNFTLAFRRATHSSAVGEEDYLDGAFMFHDEQVLGTLQPQSRCDAHHYGLSSPMIGVISAPSAHHQFWNVEGAVRCTHQFIPSTNQSIDITIRSLSNLSGSCVTACGDAGCKCTSPGEESMELQAMSLDLHDHLLLLSQDGTVISCLCGEFQADWLPVSVRSWGGVHVIYSVAHYTWITKGFAYTASYHFYDDSDCGQHTYTAHSGEISSKNLSSSGSLNSFFHQQCTWILDSNVERQLYIEISTNQSRPCVAWNVSIHEYSPVSTAGKANAAIGLARHAGTLLHTFCPRDKDHTYSLPWRLNTVVIRAVALTRTQPLYTIKWKSQVVRANTRIGSPTPAPAASRAPDLRHFTNAPTHYLKWIAVNCLLAGVTLLAAHS